MAITVAALTMVKDDYFFLQKWIDYYGGQLGRQSLFIISHGENARIQEMAAGCTVITIPGGFDKGFDQKRWRMLSGFANGLRSYFDFVICGDVDEYVVVDPETGLSLVDFLEKRKRKLVLTPIGLEVIHDPLRELDPIEPSILAARHLCRFSTYFCKPCIIGVETKFSRGGHHADFPELKIFGNLYLFHMKYCDKETYLDVARRRRDQSLEAFGEVDKEDTGISAHWLLEADEAEKRFGRLARMERLEDFVFTKHTNAMAVSWKEKSHGLWHFDKDVPNLLFTIPDRFAGLL